VPTLRLIDIIKMASAERENKFYRIVSPFQKAQDWQISSLPDQFTQKERFVQFNIKTYEVRKGGEAQEKIMI